jgi:hypothetical protein
MLNFFATGGPGGMDMEALMAQMGGMGGARQTHMADHILIVFGIGMSAWWCEVWGG